MPNLPQILGDPDLQRLPSESVVVRFEYQENGRAFEEEFCGIKTQNQAQGGTSVQINWGFARLFSFRAEKGKLDAQRNLFWQIARSVQNNPQWQQLFNQTVQQLNGQFNQHIQGVYAKLQGEAQYQQQLTSYYQQQRDQQNANINWGIERQNQINAERSHTGYSAQDAWGDALMNRTAYQDPQSAEGNYHYVEGNPQYVWTDGQDRWEASDDPLYDPNIGSNRNWTLAKKP